MKNFIYLLLIGFLMVLTTAHSCEEEVAEKVAASEAITDLGPFEFMNRMKKEPGILIDVRTPGEFSEVHIAGALNIDINSDDFNTAINELDKDTTYYIYCHAGARSIAAAIYMEETGFKRIYNLEDGIASWIRMGFPVIRQPVPGLGLPTAAN